MHIEMRSDGVRDQETGERLWPLPKLLDWLSEIGVENPTEENVKGHWRKHCSRVQAGTVEASQVAALDMVEKLKKGGGHADPDETLRTVVTMWETEMLERIARGDKSGITTDHMLKAQAELTRRSHSETQNELLSMFGQGMGQAFKALAGRPQAVIEQGIEAEDAVFTEIEEGVDDDATGSS